MILVTLGTQDKSFKRLLDAIEKQIEKGNIKDEVIVQAGCTSYESEYMKIFDLIPSEEFEELIQKCDLLITHGGVGTILAGIKNNKKVIATPRLKKYKEHVNDHQKQIVKEFAKNGYILELRDFNALDKTIEKLKTWKPKKFKSNTSEMVNLIKNYIDKTEDVSVKQKIKNLWIKYREMIMYLIFGVLTTVVSLVVYYGLVYTVLNPENAIQLQVANIVSWMMSVAFAYITNRKFVFESKNENKVKEAGSFILSRVVTLLMDMAIMFMGVTIIHGNDKIMKLISQVTVIISNYIFSKIFVFKSKE